MKLISIFSFLGIEVSIKGDVDWVHGMKLSDLGIDIEYHNGSKQPTDEEFAKAADDFIQLQGRRDKELEIRNSYPDTHDRLVAIEKQLKLLSDRFEMAQAPEFIEICNQIAQIEALYPKG